MKQKRYQYEISQGEHKGHKVATDAYGVDYFGRNPETAGWCFNCHEQVELTGTEQSKDQFENVAEE